MKPVIIIPKKLMSDNDIKALKDNGFCVVQAEDPNKVKFLDSIPDQVGRTHIEKSAILLSRKILNGLHPFNADWSRNASSVFVEMLLAGTPLDRNGTPAEQADAFLTNIKKQELEKLAREEAREEFKKKKAEKERKTKEFIEGAKPPIVS